MKQNTTKTIIKVVLSVALLVASFVLVYKNFMIKDENRYLLLPTFLEGENKGPNSLEEAMQVFERKSFKELVKFGNWPVQIEDEGKNNPFLKF